MQVFSNIYNPSIINNNLCKKQQPNLCLASLQTDTFTSSKQNHANVRLVNFCGLRPQLKVNPLEKIFKELYDFKGDNVEFAKLAFRKIQDHLGLTDVFTKDLSIVNLNRPNASKTTIAKFLGHSGDMGLDEEALKTSTKIDILGEIRHEFEHYLQNEKMMRSEDIGIEKFIELDNQKTLQNHNEALFEAHMLGENGTSGEEFIKFKNEMYDKDFWKQVVAKRGVIKSGTTESEEALNYFDAERLYPDDSPYVEYYNECCNIPLKHPDYSMFIKPYRDEKNHYEYYTNILETNARRVENDIRKQYQEFVSRKTGQKLPAAAAKREPFDIQQLTKITKFDEIFDQKFGEYNLPENFKAYIYTLIGCDVPHYDAEGINNILLHANRKYILDKLNLYDIFLEKGQVNMRSQDELDSVNKFIKEYKAQSAFL